MFIKSLNEHDTPYTDGIVRDIHIQINKIRPISR
jgi:hypothetical protein